MFDAKKFGELLANNPDYWRGEYEGGMLSLEELNKQLELIEANKQSREA